VRRAQSKLLKRMEVGHQAISLYPPPFSSDSTQPPLAAARNMRAVPARIHHSARSCSSHTRRPHWVATSPRRGFRSRPAGHAAWLRPPDRQNDRVLDSLTPKIPEHGLYRLRFPRSPLKYPHRHQPHKREQDRRTARRYSNPCEAAKREAEVPLSGWPACVRSTS